MALRFNFLALALLGLMSHATSPVAAQTTDTASAPAESGPQSTTAVYGDWTTRCQRTEAGNLACEAAQYVRLSNQTQPAAQMNLSRVNDVWSFRIEVAPNVSLPGVVLVMLGGTSPGIELAWRRCLPTACIAEGNPGADTIAAWTTATEAGTFTYVDAAGRSIVYPISPRGMKAAVDTITAG